MIQKTSHTIDLDPCINHTHTSYSWMYFRPHSQVSMSGHATFRVTGWEVREVHTKAVTRAGEAQRIMASLPECIPVYTDFAYAPWPPASSD